MADTTVDAIRAISQRTSTDFLEVVRIVRRRWLILLRLVQSEYGHHPACG